MISTRSGGNETSKVRPTISRLQSDELRLFSAIKPSSSDPSITMSTMLLLVLSALSLACAYRPMAPVMRARRVMMSSAEEPGDAALRKAFYEMGLDPEIGQELALDVPVPETPAKAYGEVDVDEAGEEILSSIITPPTPAPTPKKMKKPKAMRPKSKGFAAKAKRSAPRVPKIATPPPMESPPPMEMFTAPEMETPPPTVTNEVPDIEVPVPEMVTPPPVAKPAEKKDWMDMFTSVMAKAIVTVSDTAETVSTVMEENDIETKARGAASGAVDSISTAPTKAKEFSDSDAAFTARALFEMATEGIKDNIQKGKAPTVPPPMPTPVPKPKPTPTQFKFEMPPMPEMPSMAMPEMPPLKSPFTKPASKPTKAKADSAVGKAKKVSGRKPMTSRKPSAKTQPAKKPSPPAKKGFQMPKMDDFKLPF